MIFDTSQDPMEAPLLEGRSPRPIDDVLWDLIAGDHTFLSTLCPAKIHCTPSSTKLLLRDGRGVLIARGQHEMYSVAIGMPAGDTWLAMDAEPAVRGDDLAKVIFRLLDNHPIFD